jgi:hypothetical protein
LVGKPSATAWRCAVKRSLRGGNTRKIDIVRPQVCGNWEIPRLGLDVDPSLSTMEFMSCSPFCSHELATVIQCTGYCAIRAVPGGKHSQSSRYLLSIVRNR